MISRADVLPNPEFLQVRPQRERAAIQAASVRRFAVGSNLTLLFENRTSVLWQIQEMCRVEQIVAPAAVQHEVDTYAALLPGPSELSATLLVEYPDPPERDVMLRRLLGLQDHLWFVFDGERVPARFDGEQFNDERISSVQFLRVPLTGAQRAALLDLARPVAVIVDHPAYTVTATLPASTRGALAEDLALESGGASG